MTENAENMKGCTLRPGLNGKCLSVQGLARRMGRRRSRPREGSGYRVRQNFYYERFFGKSRCLDIHVLYTADGNICSICIKSQTNFNDTSRWA